jgi:hypothetical protein
VVSGGRGCGLRFCVVLLLEDLQDHGAVDGLVFDE